MIDDPGRPGGLDEVLAALRAGSESTRIRILPILARGELTVSELCSVLGQSQPRVSRHLKQLCAAEVLERTAEGTSAFYRPSRSGPGRQVFDALVSLLDPADPVIAHDSERLEAVRMKRGVAAATYFSQIASYWDQLRSLHVDDRVVEDALLDVLGDAGLGDLLDIGTGSGRILELLADRCDRGLGVDLSPQMLKVARNRIDGLENCRVRQSDIYNLSVASESMDTVIIHHVLHFLDSPADAYAEAARVVRPGGQLVVVDFAPHELIELRTTFAHRWLGIPPDDVAGWAAAAGLSKLTSRQLSEADDDSLTVTIWSAHRMPSPKSVPTRRSRRNRSRPQTELENA